MKSWKRRRNELCRLVCGANATRRRAHQSYIIHYALSQLFNYIPSAGWCSYHSLTHSLFSLFCRARKASALLLCDLKKAITPQPGTLMAAIILRGWGCPQLPLKNTCAQKFQSQITYLPLEKAPPGSWIFNLWPFEICNDEQGCPANEFSSSK